MYACSHSWQGSWEDAGRLRLRCRKRDRRRHHQSCCSSTNWKHEQAGKQARLSRRHAVCYTMMITRGREHELFSILQNRNVAASSATTAPDLPSAAGLLPRG